LSQSVIVKNDVTYYIDSAMTTTNNDLYILIRLILKVF